MNDYGEDIASATEPLKLQIFMVSGNDIILNTILETTIPYPRICRGADLHYHPHARIDGEAHSGGPPRRSLDRPHGRNRVERGVTNPPVASYHSASPVVPSVSQVPRRLSESGQTYRRPECREPTERARRHPGSHKRMRLASKFLPRKSESGSAAPVLQQSRPCR